MVGVSSPSALSGAGGSSSASSSGVGGIKEQRVSSKPFHAGPASQTDPTPPGQNEVDRILEQLTLRDDKLKKIMQLMNAEMDKGLHPDTQEQVRGRW